MADTLPTEPAHDDYLTCRSSETDDYSVWRIDINADQLLQRVPGADGAKFDHSHQLISIGNYVLEWGPATLQAYGTCFPYRLFKFDARNPNPLNANAVIKGIWPKTKFWQYRPDFGNPHGANEGYDKGEKLMLVPMGNFVLNVIPTTGRGTFQLFNFDPSTLVPGPGPHDPLPGLYTPQGSFDSIRIGHELIPLGNYVLDRIASTREYWLWSFDPQNIMPLAQPTVQQGRWDDIDGSHRLIPIGEHVLDWDTTHATYRLWRFDPKSADPLTGPVRSGPMPAGIDATMTMTAFQCLAPIDPVRKEVPGTMDFMRTKIKHVVYYMVENRSFDHVMGWLYEKGETGIQCVGRDGPFNGADTTMYNEDPDAWQDKDKVYAQKYNGGKLSDDVPLDFLPDDPYHDKTDVLRQYFFANRDGYAQRATPDMGGFVTNNGVHEVMWGYSPEQLPVLNGLARSYAVSDAWFSSMPGATDPNRAFAFTGSALGQLNNFQNGTQYTYWPYTAHRPSIWKVLWSNGLTDWKIYNSVEWMSFVHTYHLFLQGQIPTVDARPVDFIAGIDQFKADARAGKLPAFSLLEPAWIARTGTTSYHPGADLVPGEVALNEIYEALKAGPVWNETLLIVTFDEHGGLFDHVPPPYAENPWPNDVNDGFRYDLMGVRVPTILVSPWIREQTVFRSATPVAYDATSILATLLHWHGVPRARWGLGDRTHHAPTFEAVFQCNAPRSDAPSFAPPHDKEFPGGGKGEPPVRLNELHRLMAPRLIAAVVGDSLGHAETRKVTDDILARASDVQTLHGMISDLAKKLA